jgi:hypothetical protein
MLKVQGTDPGVVSRRLQHHGERLRPIITACLYALVLESDLARDGEVHFLYQSRGGPGSFGLYLSDGRQFHFRLRWLAGTVPYLAVLDAMQNGNEVARITRESQARRFMRRLRVAGAKAA